MSREAKSFCAICTGLCGVVLTIDDDDRITGVRGDKSHPNSQGYACLKGLQSAHLYHGPQRLLNPLRRRADGGYEVVSLEEALDEIASKLKAIMGREHPDAVALYRGTAVAFDALGTEFDKPFLAALGSRSFFSSTTIDQSAKAVAADRLGSWKAGKPDFHSVDAMVIFGANPLVSLGLYGFDVFNPVKKLKAFKARGAKLIVIDPRRTETAQFADIFVQPLPGEDVSIAAGMLRIILSQGLQDHAFCDAYVEGLDALRRAVEPFTPDYVARRAGLDAAQLEAATRAYAGAGRAFVTSGTGPSMSQRSNLAEHLLQCLDVVCGNVLRPGDRVSGPGLMRAPVWKAEVAPPERRWTASPPSRLHRYGMLNGEKLSGLMAQEITTPGDGQVKAMIVHGGNPAIAVPDQARIVDALKQLELLVVIDPEMTATARLAHYILPPTLNFERANLANTLRFETKLLPHTLQQYGRPVIRPPPGSEVTDAWQIFWSLASRLDKQLVFDGVPLDMTQPPQAEDLLRLMFRNGRISFDDLKQHDGAAVFEVDVRVEPGASTDAARFDVAPHDILTELAEVASEPFGPSGADSGYDLLLVNRRLREVFNSAGQNNPVIRQRQPYNAAYLNPEDLAARGLGAGDRVQISSSAGQIDAIVQPDPTVRQGVISMAHSWGGLPGEGLSYDEVGACTGLLVSTEHACEAINAMPRMSAVPVRVLKRPA